MGYAEAQSFCRGFDCRLLTQAAWAEPEIVTGPAAEPECFVPWAADTKFFKYPAKEPPYRIAFANGYVANTWRIQMIKTAKAYAEQPEVAAKLKEFKVVSTGEDVAAQISAINNFIDSGYDADRRRRAEPAALIPVVKRAKEAGVVLVAFDGTVDDPKTLINVNVDQKGLGILVGELACQAPSRGRQDPRSARRRRPSGRRGPPRRHPRDARRHRQDAGKSSR